MYMYMYINDGNRHKARNVHVLGFTEMNLGGCSIIFIILFSCLFPLYLFFFFFFFLGGGGGGGGNQAPEWETNT